MFEFFDTILVNPMVTVLTTFSHGMGGYLGLAIIALTIIVRFILMPLTLRQLRSTKAMQELQPKIQELQKKYGKDKQKLSDETMKLYKEHKINPLGCIWPMLLQLPIWIALYYALFHHMLGDNMPAGVNPNFLWMNLTEVGVGNLPLAILVMLSMYVLQKMSTPPSVDPKQQQMGRIMMYMMPLMFGIITLILPSGLGLYFLVSNIMSLVIQYRVTGWGQLRLPSRGSIPFVPWGKPANEAKKPAVVTNPQPIKEERTKDGKRRDKRKDRRRSHRAGSK